MERRLIAGELVDLGGEGIQGSLIRDLLVRGDQLDPRGIRIRNARDYNKEASRIKREDRIANRCGRASGGRKVLRDWSPIPDPRPRFCLRR